MPSNSQPVPRYEDVTWTTGIPVSEENASQIYTRYFLATERAVGKRVLEIGCGAGQGLGLLQSAAKIVVGGDYSDALLRSAHSHYDGRVPLVRLSAERLPFATNSFDLVLFFEASYYVPDMESAFDEIARVLAPDGAIFFSNHNPEQPGFIRSPHSHHYHSADEFRSALSKRGFEVNVNGAFPTAASGGRGKLMHALLTIARRVLSALHLVPRTLRGRAFLKRLVAGKLRPIPPELFPDFAAVAPTAPLRAGPAPEYRALYVHARRIRRS